MSCDRAERLAGDRGSLVIFGSGPDKALALAARRAGQHSRLGSFADPAKVADVTATLLDVAAFKTGTGPFNGATSPALIRILDRLDQWDGALDPDLRLRVGFVPGILLTSQNATVGVLFSIAAIGEQVALAIFMRLAGQSR